MKKIIDGLLICACIGLASPALAAKTVVINQVADIQSSWFPSETSSLWAEAPSIVKVAGRDIVEGTLWFRGGHIRALDPASFYVTSKMEFTNGGPSETPIRTVQFLNEKGETFGRSRYEGYYSDLGSIGGFAPEETGPFDVYGIKYRIEYRGIVMGWALEEVDLSMRWWRLNNASYAPGDIFASAVPEPSSWAMMALGFAGLGLAMRRRRAGGVVAPA